MENIEWKHFTYKQTMGNFTYIYIYCSNVMFYKEVQILFKNHEVLSKFTDNVHYISTKYIFVNNTHLYVTCS